MSGMRPATDAERDPVSNPVHLERSTYNYTGSNDNLYYRHRYNYPLLPFLRCFLLVFVIVILIIRIYHIIRSHSDSSLGVCLA